MISIAASLTVCISQFCSCLCFICVCFNVKQAHERFEEPKLEAVRENNVELVQDILKELTPLTEQSQAAHELARILSEPHFQVYTQRRSCTSQPGKTVRNNQFHIGLQSLLETHDSVASKSYETPPPSPCVFMDPAFNNQPVPPDAVRMVGIRKVSGEHLVRPGLVEELRRKLIHVLINMIVL